MRRDVYIENDSGGLSVIAAAAADAIIEDGREDDMRFVSNHEALLLELYGDDSMPVRVVVDEPLTADEEAQWLARVSWRIDAPDGRVLVMGGFDPDVLSWWRDEQAPDEDGRGVAVVAAAPGSWRVDVYAHAGSMNGRNVLYEAGEPVGAFFRRSHPDRPLPLWVAKMLDLSGAEDPGHEQSWQDVATSVENGALQIDTDDRSVVGFLVHLTPFDGAPLPEPEYGWFGCDEGARVPDVFPLGLPASVPDPDLEWFRDRILRIERPNPPLPPATAIVEVIEVWSGEPARALSGDPVAVALAEAYLPYWAIAMTTDSPPEWELWVTVPGGWSAPEPTEYFGVARRAAETWALGAPPGYIGWALWWGVRAAAQTLGDLPAGATLELGLAPRIGDEDGDGDELDPAIGRAFFGGAVAAGSWHIAEGSPAVDSSTLADALAFVREAVVGERITVRGPQEREALDAAAERFLFGDEVIWDGDTARLGDPDERTLILLAEQVFRVRFASHWPCDAPEDDE